MLVPRFEKRTHRPDYDYPMWGIVDYERDLWFPYGGTNKEPPVGTGYNPDWWEQMRYRFVGPNLADTKLIEQGSFLFPDPDPDFNPDPDLNLAPWDRM